uniref:GRF-type domain-containing protein n=1 Tax=Chenopodium quinoa TaxID=63459 RepID=A0A803N1P5_CHEQI
MAGGSSGSYSNTRGGTYPRTRCSCGMVAVVRTVKRGHNNGAKFYGCPKWPETNCNFMKWVDCNPVEEDLCFQIFEKDTTIAEMELHMSSFEDRVKKLEVKKLKLEDLVKELKKELCQLRMQLVKASRTETQLLMALFFSWLLFGIVVVYLK